MDSNPIKSNRPVACWKNQFANWFYPYCFAVQSKPSNPPSPPSRIPPAHLKSCSPSEDIAFGGVFFVAERRTQTHLNPTGRWTVGKPVRKLVLSLLLCCAKQAIEFPFHRWKVGYFSDRSCLTTTIFRALRGYR